MILICGAGAVGTILATLLAVGGRPVALFARDKDVSRFEASPGLRLDPAQAGGATLQAPIPALVGEQDLAAALPQVEALVIAVKFPDLAGLLAGLPAELPSGCTLVCTLNGVAPLRQLRAAFPRAAVVPMSVMFNGQLVGPLHARIATAAEIVLGSTDPALAATFRVPGLRVKQAAGDAAVWGKLLINLANAICALTRSTFRQLFLDPDLRRCYCAVLDETVAALEASRTPWQMPLVLPYPAYRWMLAHGGPLPWWFARWRNGVREGAFPSMVADVDAGRPTEVTQINGEVVRLGGSCGVPTPVNARLVELLSSPGLHVPRISPAELRRALGL